MLTLETGPVNEREGNPGDHPGTSSREAAAGWNAVDAAVSDLRAEIQNRLTHDRESLAPAQWARFFQVLRRRAGPLGMSERTANVDLFGMDRDIVQSMLPVMDFFADRYWRIEVRGAENLPRDAPSVLVANAGGPVPYDALMLSHVFARLRNPVEHPHFLVADWLVSTPFVQPGVTRLGGVRACHANAQRLLQWEHPMIVFPEGFRGSAKPFQDRYQLAPFGTETGIRAGIEAGATLVPVGIVGAEEAHPILYKDSISGRALGLPFVPLTPTFPMLGLLGLMPLPSKWVISIGEPLSPELATESGAASSARTAKVAAHLRDRVQELVDLGLRSRESVWA